MCIYLFYKFSPFFWSSINIFYDISPGESNPFGDLMKNMMTAGAEFGQQLVKNNPELANLQSNMMDQDQDNDGLEFSEAKVCTFSYLPPPL